MKSEYFIGLSLPIDQDGDPGDGGQAKDGFFDKGDDENERGIVSYKPREAWNETSAKPTTLSIFTHIYS